MEAIYLLITVSTYCFIWQRIVYEKYRSQTSLGQGWDKTSLNPEQLTEVIPQLFARVNVYATSMTVESVEESPKYDVTLDVD
jgi:hypothetical protein